MNLLCPSSPRVLLRLAASSLSWRAAKGLSPTACLGARRLGCSSCRARSTAWPYGDALRAAASPGSRGVIQSSLWLRDGRHRHLFTSAKVIRHYEHLPRDYRDRIGLAFGPRDLTEEEAERILGPGIGAAGANRLLRVLHGRRVAGTLDDPAFAVHTAHYGEDQLVAGLAYLRKEVPVDEVMNAGLRAEDELAAMEQQQQQQQQEAEEEKAKRSKVRPRGAGDGESETPAPTQTTTTTTTTATDEYTPGPIYGQSILDEMRARNLAKDKARQRAVTEARRKAEAQTEHGPAGDLVAETRNMQPKISNPAVAKYYKEAQSTLEAPPELTAWERIAPSAVAVVLVLGFMAAVAAVYEEPQPQYRLLRELTTSQATVGALIGINVLVFLGWRAPPLWSLFNRYMVMVVATVKPVTLFTAPFSHIKLSHLMVNMVPLWFIGTRLHDEIGRGKFLALYLGCGAVGFLGSLATYTLGGWLTVTSLGASGATLGLLAAYFWEHRSDGFRILDLPPEGVHGIVFLAMVLALQLAGLRSVERLKLDVASHLWGMAAGIAGIELIQRSHRDGGGGDGGQRRPQGETEAEEEEKAKRAKAVIDLWNRPPAKDGIQRR